MWGAVKGGPERWQLRRTWPDVSGFECGRQGHKPMNVDGL